MTWEINAFDVNGNHAHALRRNPSDAANVAANFLGRGWDGVVITRTEMDPISITFPNGQTLTLRSVL